MFNSSVEILTLKNPSEIELKWKIDLSFKNNFINNTSGKILSMGESFKSVKDIAQDNSNLLKKKSTINFDKFCFEIEKLTGVINPRSVECINICFNPY